MIQFILNNQLIKTDVAPGTTMLDFVRYHQHLVGTKIGCREGDCGACTVLIGELKGDQLEYKSVTSCITPLGNIQGKHLVTIEGLNMAGLTPYQKAMIDESGTQCGICTVGFVVSLAGECLADHSASTTSVISAIDGNICRCTGYKSIERAAAIIADQLADKDINNPIPWLVNNQFIPEYFLTIAERLGGIETEAGAMAEAVVVGGGTDLYVQKHDEIAEADIQFISNHRDLIGICQKDDQILIGAATNATQLMESKLLQELFPNLYQHLKLVSSTPIRNLGTIAGNFVNASPIGDLTIFFLALDSSICLKNRAGKERIIRLKDFYLAYKKLDKTEDEHITYLSFKILGEHTFFNFEKVSKRTYLDIASVNTALSIKVKDQEITEVHVSAGGVGPTPKYLEQTCQFLRRKTLNVENIVQAALIIQEEISPISDIRGSAAYKRLLLRQLFYSHFLTLFPERFTMADFDSAQPTS